MNQFGIQSCTTVAPLFKNNTIGPFILTTLGQEGNLSENEALKELIAYMIYNDYDETRHPSFAILLLAAGERATEILRIIEVNREYLDNLHTYANDLNQFEDAFQKGAWVNATNNKGLCALRVAVNCSNLDLVNRIINRCAQLDIVDIAIETPLFAALRHTYSPKSTAADRAIALTLIERGAKLDKMALSNESPLTLPIKHLDWEMIQQLIEYGASTDLILRNNAQLFDEFIKLSETIKNKEAKHQLNTNLVILAASLNNNEYFTQAIALPSDLLALNDKDGNSLFHLTAHNPSHFKLSMAQLPEEHWLSTVKMTNRKNQSVLECALPYPETLKIIIQLIPESRLLNLIQELDSNEQCLLYIAATCVESLRLLLPFYLQIQSLDELLQARDSNNGRTLLHWAATNHQSLEFVLALYPPEQQREAIKVLDNESHTLLHLANKNYKSIQLILGLHPEEDRLGELLKRSTRWSRGDTALDYIGANKEIIIKMLGELIPATARLAMLRALSNSTIIKESPVHEDWSLWTIMPLIPSEQRIELLTLPLHMSGNTPLDYAQNVPALIALIAPEHRLTALGLKNRSGCPLMAEYMEPEQLEETLSLILPAEIEAALNLVNARGVAVQELAKKNPELLTVMQRALSRAKESLDTEKGATRGSVFFSPYADSSEPRQKSEVHFESHTHQPG